MDNCHVVELHGQIDLAQQLMIERDLDEIQEPDGEQITILDLAGVYYLDTTFLNALMRTRERRKMERPGNRICLVAPRTSMIWRLFEITKLDAVFGLFDDLASARRGLSVALPNAVAT